MKTNASKTLALTATVALTICGISTPAKAAHQCDPLVHSAQQLVGLLTNLKEDFRKHYYHTPKFRTIMQDTGDMRKRANHILEIAVYKDVSIQHLEADVAEIDRLSHKLHNLVDRNEQKRNGHVHGNTKHTHRMLASMTNIIHTMQQQIQVLKQPRPIRYGNNRGHYSHNTRFTAPVQPRPVYSTPVTRQPVYSAPASRTPATCPQTSNQGFATRGSYGSGYYNNPASAFENTGQWYRGH